MFTTIQNVRKMKHTFDHLALGVGFACFDDFVICGIKLKAVGLLGVLHNADLDVFQGDDALRFFVLREFEIVEAVVFQDEPSTLPALVTTTCQR
jgi:hypothetical protein